MKNKKGGKAQIREEYFKQTNVFPLDNINAYRHWLEEVIVENLSLSDVVNSFYCYDETVQIAEETGDEIIKCDKQCKLCKL
tara:strand:- start:1094 stop:1336 length:243 start_codon:yes stop_codon:yes gene_type:complete